MKWPRRLGKAVEILDAPQQRLAAVQNDGKIGERKSDDMLLDALQQTMLHVRTHQLRFAVNGRVAKPVTIGAVDVTSRRDLDQQLRNWLILEGDTIWTVSRHADTETSWKKFV